MIVYILYLVFVVFKRKPYYVKRMEELNCSCGVKHYKVSKIVAYVCAGLCLPGAILSLYSWVWFFRQFV